jgi:hypothetical protein
VRRVIALEGGRNFRDLGVYAARIREHLLEA